MQYFNDYFSQQRYKDDFGWSADWNIEIDKWLATVHSIDSHFYNRSKNRVKNEKQRDEFLGEAKSTYFINKIVGLNVVAFDPLGEGSAILDLSFEDDSKEIWNVEVKTPSWRGEIYKDDSMTGQQKKARLQQPQFINGEGRFFSVRDALEDPIKNSLHKFVKGQNNILVITPNMLSDTLFMPFIDSTVKEEVRGQDFDELISAVLLLQPQHFMGENIRYFHEFISINKLPSYKPFQV